MVRNDLDPGTHRSNELVRLLAELKTELGAPPGGVDPAVTDDYLGSEEEREPPEWFRNRGERIESILSKYYKVYGHFEYTPVTESRPVPRGKIEFSHRADDPSGYRIHILLRGFETQVTVHDGLTDEKLLNIKLDEFDAYEAVRYDAFASIARRAREYDESVTSVLDYLAVSNSELEADAIKHDTSDIKYWSDLRDRHYETIRENVRAVETAEDTYENMPTETHKTFDLTEEKEQQIQSILESVNTGKQDGGFVQLFDNLLSLVVFTTDATYRDKEAVHMALVLHETPELLDPERQETYPPLADKQRFFDTHIAFEPLYSSLRSILEEGDYGWVNVPDFYNYYVVGGGNHEPDEEQRIEDCKNAVQPFTLELEKQDLFISEPTTRSVSPAEQDTNEVIETPTPMEDQPQTDTDDFINSLAPTESQLQRIDTLIRDVATGEKEAGLITLVDDFLSLTVFRVDDDMGNSNLYIGAFIHDYKRIKDHGFEDDFITGPNFTRPLLRDAHVEFIESFAPPLDDLFATNEFVPDDLPEMYNMGASTDEALDGWEPIEEFATAVEPLDPDEAPTYYISKGIPIRENKD